MEHNIKKILLVIGIIAAGFILILLLKHFLLPYGVNNIIQPVINASIQMEGVHLSGMKNHHKTWSMDADVVQLSKDRSFTTLTKIRNGKIYKNDRVAAGVQAGTVRYSLQSGELVMSGGIIVTGNRREQISCSGAFWNPNTYILSNLGKAVFESQWGRVESGDVKVDIKNKEINITKAIISINPDAIGSPDIQ